MMQAGMGEIAESGGDERWVNRTKIPFLNGCQCRFCISLEKTARSGAWRGRCIAGGQ
jgi:hypothetical protein